MVRTRQPYKKHRHYALLVNRSAGNYRSKPIEHLIAQIKDSGGSFSVFEPDSAMDMLKQAEVAVGRRQPTSGLERPFSKAGAVNALIACGGDGTFNLVARAAHKAALPVGLLPLGKENNLARSLYGTADPENAITQIMTGSLHATDVGSAANLPFFGSIGFGFVPQMAEELQGRKLPQYGISWSRLGASVAASVDIKPLVLKVDSFMFEIKPILFNVNLLPYSVGLALSPSSIRDDGMAEIIFDQGESSAQFSSYTRQVYKNKYLYGSEIRLYRGKVIRCHSEQARTLYLDGELIDIAAESLEIKIDDKKLQVLG